MDIKAITEFLDIVNIKHATTNMSVYCQNINKLEEYKSIVYSKNKDFNDCVMQWCMTNGINAAHSLLIYKDELQRQLQNYRHEKKLYDSLFFATDINYNSHPQMLSPLSKNYKYVRLTTEHNYNEYKIIRRYLSFMILVLSDSIKFIDKELVTYGVQQATKEIGDFIVHDEVDVTGLEERRTEKLSHFNDKRTDDQLKIMLKELIKLNYIAADTSESDFIYYLSGRGCKPKDCLRWNSADGMGVVLAVFINYFYGEESKKWKKGELIFGKKHLCQSYTQSLDNATYSSHFDKMKDIERKMR